jgi:hypothetical protein
MVSETAIMAQANQTAYETVEMARVQANEMLAQAVAESNEIRLGSMQYTNDIMLGIRNYVEATMEAERANYENLIQTLNNDYMIADANLTEIQNQIVEFTGNPSSVTKAPKMKTMKPIQTERRVVPEEPKQKTSVVDKVMQVVTGKEEKEVKKEAGPGVNIPDFITSGEKVVPNETPLEPNVSVKADNSTTQTKKVPEAKTPSTAAVQQTVDSTQTAGGVKKNETVAPIEEKMVQAEEKAVLPETPAEEKATEGTPKKVKKKIVKKRNPVMHTPQTAQETVAKTLEAAAAVKVDKTVYKANGEQAREVPPMEGRVKRGPRVGRSVVDETIETTPVESAENASFEVTTEPMGKSMGVVDDLSMPEKF